MGIPPSLVVVFANTVAAGRCSEAPNNTVVRELAADNERGEGYDRMKILCLENPWRRKNDPMSVRPLLDMIHTMVKVPYSYERCESANDVQEGNTLRNLDRLSASYSRRA